MHALWVLVAYVSTEECNNARGVNVGQQCIGTPASEFFLLCVTLAIKIKVP